MRIRRFRALVLSVLLASTLSVAPISAAPRDRDGGWFDREFPFIVKVLNKIKRSFGVSPNSDGLTLPKP